MLFSHRKILYFVIISLLLFGINTKSQAQFMHANSQINEPGKFDNFFDPSDYVWLGYSAASATYSGYSDDRVNYFLREGFITNKDTLRPMCRNPYWYGEGKESSLGQGWTVSRNDAEKISVFAFRGTDNGSNGLQNIDFTPHKIRLKNERNIWVHSGFWRSWNSVQKEVRDALFETPAEHKIIITGHSLGAAVAQIAAVYFDVFGKKPDAVFLFASPLAGDKSFKEAYQDYVGCNRTIRIAAKGDLVNDIPDVYGYTNACDATTGDPDYTSKLKIHNLDLGYKNIMYTLFPPTATDSEKGCPTNKVGIYSGFRFSGDSVFLPFNSTDLGKFNNRFSSYYIPKGRTATFYVNKGMDATGRHLKTSVSSFYNQDIGQYVKSVRIVDNNNAVNIYSNMGLTGEKVSISSNSPNLDFFNEYMQSYTIPKGWKARFFTEKNYQGEQFTRDSSYKLVSDIERRIRSVKILKMSDGVSLYDGYNRNGKERLITENTPDLDTFNDRTISMNVPAGWRARIYDGVNYTGIYYDINGGKNGRSIYDVNNFDIDGHLVQIKSVQIMEKKYDANNPYDDTIYSPTEESL